MLSIPMNYNGIKYTLTDAKTILCNADLFLYMGVVFIQDGRYRKYMNGDRKIFLVEF